MKQLLFAVMLMMTAIGSANADNHKNWNWDGYDLIRLCQDQIGKDACFGFVRAVYDSLRVDDGLDCPNYPTNELAMFVTRDDSWKPYREHRAFGYASIVLLNLCEIRETTEQSLKQRLMDIGDELKSIRMSSHLKSIDTEKLEFWIIYEHAKMLEEKVNQVLSEMEKQ